MCSPFNLTMPSLYKLPDTPHPPASNARLLYDQNRLEEVVAFCLKELPLIARDLPARSQRRPPEEEAASAAFQYFALTAILVDALAELGRWKAAKEALGRYRVRFPKDPWGFSAGAEITARDPEVKDREAVGRAAELLRTEADRLAEPPPAKKKGK